jgi:hypothetical protein
MEAQPEPICTFAARAAACWVLGGAVQCNATKWWPANTTSLSNLQVRANISRYDWATGSSGMHQTLCFTLQRLQKIQGSSNIGTLIQWLLHDVQYA